MRDELYLGPVPLDEDCSQVGSVGYLERSRVECRAYINQLKRQFGDPPEGGGLRIKQCPHDFGTYHEVVAVFDDLYPDSCRWAFEIEEDLPLRWDSDALIDLTILTISSK